MKIFCFVILQVLSYKHNLLKQFADFQEKTGNNQVSISASIKSITDKNSFLEYNHQLALSPASTQKLITTATALLVLGEQFRFETRLMTDGQVINNTLKGNLFISGNGDPSFGSARNGKPFETQLNEWAWLVKKTGIQKIEGRVIVSSREFDSYDIPGSWLWGDMGNYYGAAPLDINLNENYFTVYFKGGAKPGDPAEATTLKPFDKDWTVFNQVKSAEKGSGDQVTIFSSPLSRTILMKGTVPYGSINFPVKGSVPNPPELIQKLFTSALQERGISIEGQVTGLVMPEKRTLDVVSSIPLRDIISECNYYSINLYADALAKAICRNAGLEPTFENYEKFVKSYWLGKGVDLQAYELEDGSGLSPANFLSTDKMTALLAAMTREPAFAVFFRSVPVVGVNGTVAMLDKQKKTRGMVRAKSGSISKTRTYAGYFNNKEGKSYCFMIHVSRYPKDKETEVKVFLENILVNLIDLDQ